MNKSSSEPRVIIHSFSSVIFLYPSLIASILCGLWVQFGGANTDNPGPSGLIFTLVFFFNLSVIAFEFTRLASIVLVLLFVIAGLVSTMFPAVGHFIKTALDQPMFMNATFYWVWAVGLTILLVSVVVKSRFDYWEVKNNELLHHHGMLGDVQRWPAPSMRISKEINDVMEYILLRAGRLVIQPAGESRAIVIDNVPRISHIEQRMQDILSRLRVADDDKV